MLDPRKLQLLVDVSRTGTIAGAAARARCTASAASRQLGVLEEQTELRLLEPAGRGVRLTEAGRLLVAHATPILGALETAEAALRAHRERLADQDRARRPAAAPAAPIAIPETIITR
ncbi:LysR family transcriptional regulator [Streptomyces sp. BI20]|uniref:LysR family transcriptional regulator n=1 Tax=Streptomyces sp. BI20 TaxID=3403460 RepID=UPI003C78D61A